MKLLSLNIWAGRRFEELIDYIKVNSQEIDLFCFQEVFSTSTNSKKVNENYRANIFEEIQNILPNHQGYFAPAQDYIGVQGVDFELYWGLAIFIRKSLKVKEVKDFFIRGYRNSRQEENYRLTIPYNLQYVLIEFENKIYTIAHLHGLWNGEGKTDTNERIDQSNIIKQFLAERERIVLCGDFNLLPETKSLIMLEGNLTNLIKLKGVKSTRSSFYEKPEKFADYTLVSKDIEISNFEVFNVEVSDHLPMILDFS